MESPFSFIQESLPCGRCGFPLPATRLYAIARDDSGADVVASVTDGSINRIDCGRCGFRGWISVPLLWVDRGQKRAVYVAQDGIRHDERQAGLRQRLEMALHDVADADRSVILARLQQVKYPWEMRAALELSPEQAEAEHLAYRAFQRREILPLHLRLEQFILDATTMQTVCSEGRELSPEFLAMAKAELAKISEDDMSPRAQILRQMVPSLAQRVPAQTSQIPGVPEANRAPLPDSKMPDVTAALLEMHSRAPGERSAANAPESESQPLPDPAELILRVNDPDADAAARMQALHELTIAHLGWQNHAEAYAAARELIDAATTAGDARARADAMVFAGVALARSGEPMGAISYLSAAEAEQEQLDGVDPQVMGLHAEASGDACRRLSDYPNAKRAYELAAEWYERAGRPDGVRIALDRLAGACMNMGETGEAAAVFRRLLEELEPDSVDAIRTRLNLGMALALAASPPELTIDFGYAPAAGPAPDAETRTEDRLDAPPPELPQGLRARIEAKVRKNDGEEHVLFESIAGDEAIDQLAEARRAAIRAGAHHYELESYAAMANAYLEYKMLLAARDVLQLAIRRHEQLGIPVGTKTLLTLASVWEGTADDAWQKGNARDAERAWSEGEALFERALNSRYHHNQGPDEILATAYHGRAKCLEALGRRAEARECYRKAMGMFEGGRRHLLERHQKEFVQGRGMIVFPRAQRNDLALYAETGDVEVLEEAFSLAEAGRSRILLDLLGANEIARPASIEAIAAGLPEGSALVQYSLVPTYANCAGSWAIYTILPRTGLAPFVVRQDLDEVLAARDAFYVELERFDRRSLHEHAACDAALERLGALLLPESLLGMLRERGVERLIFAPEAYVFDVPFAALRVRWNGEVDDLCRAGVETIVVPSASAYLAAGRRGAKTSAASLLCISDPQRNLRGVAEWVDRNIRREWRGASERLTHDAASVANVLEALPRSRVVFYFGHGSEKGLVLHDGELTMQELTAPVQLDCDLLLALACFGARVETDQRSREVLGLSAALLQLGARNVIGGLWPLLVGFAKDFGVRLMRYVAEGAPIGAAQLRALNDTRIADRRWNHPYVWGGIRLTGTGYPLSQQEE